MIFLYVYASVGGYVAGSLWAGLLGVLLLTVGFYLGAKLEIGGLPPAKFWGDNNQEPPCPPHEPIGREAIYEERGENQ
jgi:hypothetical protein